MNPRSTALRHFGAAIAALLLAAGTAQAALDTSAATDDHSINTPTGWWTYTNIGPADLSAALADNHARLVGLQVHSVTSGGEPRFVARLVPNSGAYAVPGWWWYYDQTPSQLASLLNANVGRLIELERYDRGGGNIRYAAVMVSNTGSAARGWSYLLEATTQQIADQVARNMRPIDLDSHGSGTSASPRRYSAVFVANSGADAKPFQWAVNQTLADVTAKVGAFSGRVVKLDRQPDGKYGFVQVKATGADATAWWHQYGHTSLQSLNDYALQFAARPVDIASYVVNGTRYYDAAFIDNANAGTRRLRGAFAAFVDANGNPRGIFSTYLKRLDTGVTIDLNSGRKAETASALKALHLLHAMRQVKSGADALNSPFVYYDYPGSGDPEDHCPQPASYEVASNSVTTTLQPAMSQMMAISDNRIARGVVLRYGGSFSTLTTTAQRTGMANTTLRHNIGCAYLAPNGSFAPSQMRNDTTAADLAHLYEGVWTQTTLTNANGARDAFLQAANPGDAWDGLQAIIDQEAAALGKSSIAGAFGNLVKRWGKPGGYGACLGAPNDPFACGTMVTIASSAGLVGLPVKTPQGIQGWRYYVRATFISDVPVSCWNCPEEQALLDAYSKAKDETLRDEVRAALQTW